MRDNYMDGDVNHNVQPIVGMLRRHERDETPLSDRDMAWAIRNLMTACQVEDVWLRDRAAHDARVAADARADERRHMKVWLDEHAEQLVREAAQRFARAATDTEATS